jgi:L-amino acid N-acyltransferase YncA
LNPIWKINPGLTGEAAFPGDHITEIYIPIHEMNYIMVDEMNPGFWTDVARIYQAGILTKNATFETQVPDWESWDKSHRKDCRWIARIYDRIVGWAALSNISNRCVYAGVAEISIYIDPDYQRHGIGSILMEKLIKESESIGIWTLQAGIFPENKGSIALHKKHGFRIIGIREKIGKMDDIWRDVALLERRSKIAGL